MVIVKWSFIATIFIAGVSYLQPCTAQNNQSFPNYENRYVPYMKNDKWGYADTSGVVLLKPTFDSVGFFDIWDNTHAIFKKNGKFGILNGEFKKVVKNKYEYLKGTNCCPKSNDKFFMVGNGDTWGVHSVKVGEIIPTIYEDIDFKFLYQEFIVVKKNRKWALFALSGDRITDFKFDYFTLGVFGGGTARDVVGNTASGEAFLIREDHSIIPAPEKPRSIKAQVYTENSEKNLKTSDRQKEKYRPQAAVIKKQYKLDSIYLDRSLGITGKGRLYPNYMVEKSGQKGVWSIFLDTVVFSGYDNYNSVWQFYSLNTAKRYGHNELWFVKKGSKWGVVDENGLERYPFIYDGFGKITQTFFETIQNEKHGIVQITSGGSPIPCNYDQVNRSIKLPLSRRRTFTLYEVSADGKNVFVGENGVEFFKMK